MCAHRGVLECISDRTLAARGRVIVGRACGALLSVERVF